MRKFNYLKKFHFSSDKLQHYWLWFNDLNTTLSSRLFFARNTYTVRSQNYNHLHKIQRAKHVTYIELSRCYQLSAKSLKRQPKFNLIWFILFLNYMFSSPFHINVLVLIEDWKSIYYFIFFNDLFFYFAFVLSIIRRINDIW